jgi:hypothetical protein
MVFSRVHGHETRGFAEKRLSRLDHVAQLNGRDGLSVAVAVVGGWLTSDALSSRLEMTAGAPLRSVCFHSLYI